MYNNIIILITLSLILTYLKLNKHIFKKDFNNT